MSAFSICDYTTYDKGLITRSFVMALFVYFVAIVDEKVIDDFHSRKLAFRGAGGEPPRLRLRGLTCLATGLRGSRS
jgi:hypothetical protein